MFLASHYRAAGSGAASTAMAVPFFQQKNEKNKKFNSKLKHHCNTFIVQHDKKNFKSARICSDIAAVSVLVVGLQMYSNGFLEGCY